MDIESQDGYISSLGFDVDDVRDMQAAGEFGIVMDMTNATKESETPGDLTLITCNVCGISQAQLINDEGGVCTITDPNAGANPNFKVGMDCPFQKYYSMVEAVSDEFIARLEEDKTIITIHEPQPEMALAAESKTDSLTKYATALHGMKNNMLRAESIEERWNELKRKYKIMPCQECQTRLGGWEWCYPHWDNSLWYICTNEDCGVSLPIPVDFRAESFSAEMVELPIKVVAVKDGDWNEHDGKMEIYPDDSWDEDDWEEAIRSSIEEGDYEIIGVGDEDWDELDVTWVGHYAWESHNDEARAEETFEARTGFVFPERKAWPIGDKQHAHIAMDYMEEGKGNPEEYDEIRDAIEDKYGDLEQFEATRGIDTFTQPFEDDEKTNWLTVGGILALVALAGYMIPKGK